MTVPVLNSNYQDKALKSALKKNVAVFNQATKRFYVENGYYYTDKDSIARANDFDSFVKYLKAEKLGENEGILYVDNYKKKDGTSISLTSNLLPAEPNVAYRLADGTEFYFFASGSIFVVDVNGSSKKPNVLYKDVFRLDVRSGGKIDPLANNNTDTYEMLYK